jgi:heme-degrading monooxygenase HmoA
MFAVIFEVHPKQTRFDEYLGIAKGLKPELERIDGFIENERFASKRVEGKLLSLSLWRDEKAVIRWRTLALHHRAQEKGRGAIFADYHLRVGEVAADSGIPEGLPAQRLDATEVGAAPAVTVSILAPEGGAADPAAARIPLGRLGTPDDIAAAIAFLIGSDAGYITGQTIHIDGGLTL